MKVQDFTRGSGRPLGGGGARQKREEAVLTLGQRLRLARVTARLSQAELARAAGTSQDSVSDFETDARLPSEELASSMWRAVHLHQQRIAPAACKEDR